MVFGRFLGVLGGLEGLRAAKGLHGGVWKAPVLKEASEKMKIISKEAKEQVFGRVLKVFLSFFW